MNSLGMHRKLKTELSSAVNSAFQSSLNHSDTEKMLQSCVLQHEAGGGMTGF